MNTRLKVSETMNADPVTESGDPSIMEAARIMRDNGVGSLLVKRGREVIGILTERDILQKVVAEGHDPREMRVSDAMTPDPITVTPRDDILEALRIMRAYRIRRLPVVEQGRLVGLVTERDISAVAPELIQIAEEWKAITDPGLGLNGGPLPSPGAVAGHCEACGQDNRDLNDVDGTLLCEDCYDETVRGPAEEEEAPEATATAVLRA